MIKVIFFDVGNVLLRQDSTVFELYDRESGWPPGTSFNVWKAHLRIAHLSSSVTFDDGGDAVVSIMQRLYSTNRVVPGMERLLQRLRVHYRLAVISNFTSDLDEVLGQLGLLSYFEDVVNSSRVGTKKPDPKIYRLACDRLGVKPIESVLIDDSRVNVESAQQAGMKGIVFCSADSLPDELSELGVVLKG
jgi:epoxide hydrolase-like predicted phosphatase